MAEEIGRGLPDWALRRVESSEVFASVESPVWVDQQGLLKLSKMDVDGRYRLSFSNQIDVELHFDEQVIVERPLSADVPRSTREHFLADQVLPRILGHQGKLVLHAAGVRHGDEAFLLLGKSGSGKSTLAASFDRAGYVLLGDDALVVTWRGGRPFAKAVYPSLRLFPDSIDAVFSEAVSTDAVAHYTPKLRVRVPLKDGGETPIRAVFVLGEHSSDTSVRSKGIADSCIALIENSFVLDPTDAKRAPRRLHDASALARHAPTFDISYPRAYSGLADVRAAILDTLLDNGEPVGLEH